MTAPLTDAELRAIRSRQGCSAYPNEDIQALVREVDRLRAELAQSEQKSNARWDAGKKAEMRLRKSEMRTARLAALLRRVRRCTLSCWGVGDKYEHPTKLREDIDAELSREGSSA